MPYMLIFVNRLGRDALVEYFVKNSRGEGSHGFPEKAYHHLSGYYIESKEDLISYT